MLRLPPPGTLETMAAVLVTGASSGIGAALARIYAAPGTALMLCGRDGERLAAVAEDCRRVGATVEAATIDVTDRVAMAEWIARCDDAAPLSLVIANAGVSAGTGGGGESAEQTRRIFAVNVDGVINTIHPALDRMAPRRAGGIAIMSSLASFRGFPGAPAYCASKAAVRVLGEALRGDLRATGIAVSVVCPGYVESPMTAVNRFPMPLLMSADRAAAIIRRGIDRGRPRIAFPWPMYAAVRLLAALPPAWSDPLLRRLPRKE
ncbi:MAG: SDR family NAD(P)-dependent oxidoreductase [Alphaproteobacteria bacterium]|nr:SDR family NAD(P)-dependent oxidoreductase [Alphaproteobacteria bacterium]